MLLRVVISGNNASYMILVEDGAWPSDPHPRRQRGSPSPELGEGVVG